MLIELEKDLSNYQIAMQKEDKRIQEYQNLFQENKILKDKLNLIQK